MADGTRRATFEKHVVVVKPGDVLLIGNFPVDPSDHPEIAETASAFFRAAGIQVAIFEGDIDIDVCRVEDLPVTVLDGPAKGGLSPAAPGGA